VSKRSRWKMVCQLPAWWFYRVLKLFMRQSMPGVLTSRMKRRTLKLNVGSRDQAYPSVFSAHVCFQVDHSRKITSLAVSHRHRHISRWPARHMFAPPMDTGDRNPTPCVPVLGALLHRSPNNPPLHGQRRRLPNSPIQHRLRVHQPSLCADAVPLGQSKVKKRWRLYRSQR
jgi:hypothetical protein